MKKIITLAAGMWLMAMGAAAAPDSTPTPSEANPYALAERFAGDKLSNMLFSTTVDPHWFKSGDKFWYSYKTGNGTRWYVVDPATRTKRELWDHDKMASELTTIVRDPYIAASLPIRNLEVEPDGHTFTFEVVSSQDAKKKSTEGLDSIAAAKVKQPKKGEKEIFFFSYDMNTGRLTHLKDKEKDTKELPWASVSPDGQTVVYAKDLNLYRMSRADYEKLKKDENDTTVVDIPLTTDGVMDFGYGLDYSYLNTDTICNGKRKGVYGLWSPDSRHFVTTLEDNRAVKPLWVINSVAEPRPTLETYKYQMPGEMEAPEEHLYLFDLTTNSRKEIDTRRFKHQTLSLAHRPRQQKERSLTDVPAIWLGDDNRLFVTRSSRDLHRIDICSYTIGQDTLVPIIEERMNTYQEVRPLAALNNGKELIQWSERDGWAHLYLYDDKGNLKRRLTDGPWHVHRILNVDPATRRVYFTGMGREAGENPYYQHLYSVSLDGGPVKLLDKGNAFHAPIMDDNAHYFVDNFSRVDTIPETALYDASGRKLMTLERSDFSHLLAAGYKFPEVFKVKAADGVTDLWGTMYKPFDFDSTKVYPIIDYVYPGPQVEATNYPFTRMAPRTDRLAQAGFIVITVGNRGGHPDRSKWYHNYGYDNMRDYGLADQKYAIEQLAARHPYIDINRVGIHGHSGGGFMSTAAILQYPDFFKTAVSCAGNHDNRIYNRWWSETHHGVKEKVTEQGDTTFIYSIKTNPEIARNLKGHLLLVHGDIDNNVHPGNSIRVADALIRANKRFDFLLLPTQRHGFGNMNEYFYWRMVDYFTDYLKNDRATHPVDIPAR
ncbi:MAG: DPP IV N-terminal domain-containing protein [Pseudoflavonifractor sp.]|nr:DPP IV N-terminal domain-containing protein [Alloprevotella sp.]MCM1117604.1 DPP IV N-terminal domain-containing protein [Pseudoflavonifractor sp.]